MHEASKPKGDPRNAIRRVPIPPVLVMMIREHIELHGTAPDGRLFQTCKGGIYLPSTLWTVLQKARKAALTEAQNASLLAHKPYDFRHAGVSWRLNAGTPAPLTTIAGSVRWMMRLAGADLGRCPGTVPRMFRKQ